MHVLLKLLEFGMDLQEAIGAPRFGHLGRAVRTQLVEQGFGHAEARLVWSMIGAMAEKAP